MESLAQEVQKNAAKDLNLSLPNHDGFINDFNNFSSAYSAYSSDYELGVANQLSDHRVTRANDLTASYQADAFAKAQKVAYYSPENMKVRGDASFNAGLEYGANRYNHINRERIGFNQRFAETSRTISRVNKQMYEANKSIKVSDSKLTNKRGR